MRPVLLLLAFSLSSFQTGCTQDLTWSVVYSMIERDFPEVRHITTDSLAVRLADTTQARPLLLDVRTAEEYTVSHLGTARRLDPNTEDFAFLDMLDRATPIVAYCSVGYRSSQIAQRLQAAGFTHVSNLQGSLFKWANEDRPVYRGEQTATQVHAYDTVWGRLLREDLRAPLPIQDR